MKELINRLFRNAGERRASPELRFFEQDGRKYVSDKGGRTLEYGISTTPHPDVRGEFLGYLYCKEGYEFYLVDQEMLSNEALRRVGLSNDFWQQYCYSHFLGGREYLFGEPIRVETRPRKG